MHIHFILLVLASSRKLAKYKINQFMDDKVNHNVCDWYQIGGRFSGMLDNYNPKKDLENYEKCNICEGTGFRNDGLGTIKRLKNPEYKCNKCACFGHNKNEYSPFGPGLALKYPTQFKNHEGDVCPLSKCLAVVREISFDPIKKVKNMESEQETHWPNDIDVKKRFLKIKNDILLQKFCIEINVFNSENNDYSIPANPTGWFAGLIDMHV